MSGDPTASEAVFARRAACLACLEQVALTASGFIAPHRGPLGSAYEPRCIGSNKPPFRSGGAP